MTAGRPVAGRSVAAALGSAVLVLSLLGGCSSQDEEYCSALADGKRELAALAARAGDGDAAGAGDTLPATLEVLEKLRGEAPDELRDEWDTVVFAYQALEDGAQEAGVDPAEVVAGRAPEGVSRKAARQLAALAAELVSPRVVDASRGIEDHAREVCEVEFRT